MADGQPDHLTWRLRLLAGIVALSLAFLVRLGSIQIVNHAKYVEEAAVTHKGADAVPAPRGVILDATGFPLATSVDTWTSTSMRSSGSRRTRRRRPPCNWLRSCAWTRAPCSRWVRRARRRHRRPPQLPVRAGAGAGSQGHLGIRLLPAQRIYPEGDLAGPVVGLVGIDGKGLWGAEADFDRVSRAASPA